MRNWMRSNVLGLVAIFIALTGSAYAANVAKNSVTSKSIADGAITSKDVKDDGLGGADIDESTLEGAVGAAGPQGPAGPQGVAGPQGPQGPAGPSTPQTIADGSITAAKLASDSVRSSKFKFNTEVAIDYGNLATNGCASMNLAVSPLNSLVASDEVLVTRPGNFPGQVVVNVEPVAGVLQTTACNVGSTPIDPASAVFEISAIAD